MSYNIIFMGTPDFALPSLDTLHHHPLFTVTSIYTQGDKPVGRKQVLTPPIIKSYGIQHTIPVHQPRSLRNAPELYAQIAAEKPDFIVVVAYGKIIPNEILDIPKYGVINVHGSVLPKHRGAAPIQAALLSGDKETGVTIMLMSEGLDEGDILEITTVPIKETDTAGSLFETLSTLGASRLPVVLDGFAKKQIMAVPQNHALATHQGKIKKTLGEIDVYTMNAIDIYHKWQGLTPWPGIHTYTEQGKRLKLLSLTPLTTLQHLTALSPGEIKPNTIGLILGTIHGNIGITSLQLEGKKPMPHEAFIQGNPDLAMRSSSK